MSGPLAARDFGESGAGPLGAFDARFPEPALSIHERRKHGWAVIAAGHIRAL